MPVPETPMKPPPRYRWTFAASIVATIGALIFAVSALCAGTATFEWVYSAIAGPPQWIPTFAPAWILVGAIPLAIGFALVREGLQMRKKD